MPVDGNEGDVDESSSQVLVTKDLIGKRIYGPPSGCGHAAAALPSPAMNSRRRISDLQSGVFANFGEQRLRGCKACPHRRRTRRRALWLRRRSAHRK